LPPEASSASGNDAYPSSVSVNFHIERVSVDGLTSGNHEINITTQDRAFPRRRTHFQKWEASNVHGKYLCSTISDPESFASLSEFQDPHRPSTSALMVSNSQKVIVILHERGPSRHREDSNRSVGEPEPELNPVVMDGHEDIPLSFLSQPHEFMRKMSPWNHLFSLSMKIGSQMPLTKRKRNKEPKR